MTQPVLSLEGDVTISTAADCRLLLQSGVHALGEDGDSTLRLDLSGVGALDSAGVQLLLATRHSLAAQAQRLHITAGNPTVNDVLRTLGLSELLDAVGAPALEGVRA